MAVIFYFSTYKVREFSFLYILDNMLLFVFLMTAILVSMEWYLHTVDLYFFSD